MLGLCLFVAYPAVAHFGRPAAALALLAALAGYIAASVWIHHPCRWLLPPIGAAAVAWASPPVEWLLFVPPIVINLGLAWLFGRTLVRGRVPLIARFAIMEQGTLSAELVTYTRTLTWLWTLLFVAAAGASLALALSGHRDAWSLFTNFLNYVLVAALLLGDLFLRRLVLSKVRNL